MKGKRNANTSYTCLQHSSWVLEGIKLLIEFFDNIPNNNSKLWILSLYHTLLIEGIITKSAGLAEANNSDQDYSAAG